MQFGLLERWGKAGTGGASAVLQLITRTSTHTTFPPPLFRLASSTRGLLSAHKEWGTEDPGDRGFHSEAQEELERRPCFT